jgi:hypothetical protein
MWRAVRILLGLAGILACAIPRLRETPLLYCASLASGVFAGEAMAED